MIAATMKLFEQISICWDASLSAVAQILTFEQC